MKKILFVLLMILILGIPIRAPAFPPTLGGGSASVSDTAYDATSWNGVTDVAPSKNAVRNKIETLSVPALDTVTNPTGAKSFTLLDNTQYALDFGSTGAAHLVYFDTRNGAEGVGINGYLTVSGLGTFGTLSAGAGGFTVGAAGDTTAKSLIISKQSGVAGDIGLYEANSTDTDAAGFRGPASLTANTSYRGQLPNARATSDNMVLAWGGTAGSGDGTPASPYIHAMTFVDLDGYSLINQTMYIGTTAVAINRGSAALVLTGITSIDGSAATLSGNLSNIASSTSANLAATLSDETGTDKVVFNTSPTLVTPNIGVATGTSFTSTQTTNPDYVQLRPGSGATNPTYYRGWIGPTAPVTNYTGYILPDADPTAGQSMAFGAVSSNKSQVTWTGPFAPLASPTFTGTVGLPSGTAITNAELTTPALGTPSALVMTNATGFPSSPPGIVDKITATFDGSGSAILVNSIAYTHVPYAITSINQWTVICKEDSGTTGIIITPYMDAFATDTLPTTTMCATGTAPHTSDGATAGGSVHQATWDCNITAIPADRLLAFKVTTAPTSATWCTVVLKVTR